MPFCIALAVRDMGMTIDEALAAATLGGARALAATTSGTSRRAPAPTPCVLDAPSHAHLIYRPGVPLIEATFVAGELARSPEPPTG